MRFRPTDGPTRMSHSARRDRPMGRFTHWLRTTFSIGRRTPTPHPLGADRLEARATPAALVTAGLAPGTNADADVADDLLGVSGDGKTILFASKASNLVAGVTDNNGELDLFWR